jgi:hypothetical protein
VKGGVTKHLRYQPSRHPFVLAGLIAFALVIGIAAIGYSANRAHRSSTAPGSGPGAPSPAQAQTLLDHHAKAVLGRARSAFVSDLDPASSASAFRSSQEDAFDNLRDVPLTSWSYTLAVPVNGPSENSEAASRYHAPVLIMRVDFSYALKYVDPAPATYQLYLTFVKQDGRVHLAGDADVQDSGGTSWHGPWEFGPIVVRRGTSSLVLAHPSYAADLAEISAAVDAAVPRVSAVWGTGWNQQVAVIVPNSQAEMNEVIDNTLPLAQIAATTFVDRVSGDKALGVRVAVNPANLTRLDPVGLRITLTHEVTLVATWATKSASTPTWLSEGFAEYVANLDTGQSVSFAASELDKEVKAGTIPAALPTTTDFTSDAARLPQVYEEAWLACRLIAERAGAAALPAFFRSVSASALTQDAAVQAAFESTLHEDTATFTSVWQQYLRTELT